MYKKDQSFTISQIAERAGVATSALRFYEKKGLIKSQRTSGNQRRYHPSVLRQISVIQIAQKLGVTLEEIKTVFSRLPDNRAPNKADWDKMARFWGKQLDERITQMQRLRGLLNGCIGCGCLSMKHCDLLNPEDTLATQGSGARYLLDDPQQVAEQAGILPPQDQTDKNH